MSAFACTYVLQQTKTWPENYCLTHFLKKNSPSTPPRPPTLSLFSLSPNLHSVDVVKA